MTVKHIFVIGAGTMGNGIAQVAATSGFQVTCMDVQAAALEKAKAAIARSTAKLVEKELSPRNKKTQQIRSLMSLTCRQ
jgi:3-hydroxybutyryl-CoA dehydrogenase